LLSSRVIFSELFKKVVMLYFLRNKTMSVEFKLAAPFVFQICLSVIVFVVFMLPPASIYIGDSNLFRYPIYQYHEIGMKKESLSPRTMKTKLLMKKDF